MENVKQRLARLSTVLVWTAAISIALALLLRIGRNEWDSIGQNVRLLKTGEPHERGYAIGELAVIGQEDPDRVVAPLIEATRDEDGYVRFNAAMALGRLKTGTPASKEASEILLSLLADNDPRVVEGAARGLGSLDGDPKVVVPALIKVTQLKDASNEGALHSLVRRAAYSSLSSYAKRGDTVALTAMLGGARDPDPELRLVVLEAIDPILLDNDEACATVLTMIGDKDPKVRTKVVRILGEISTSGSDLTGQCLKALKHIAEVDVDPGIRGQAISYLGRLIESPGDVSRIALNEIIGLTKNQDLGTRQRAIQSLGYGGDYFAEVFPLLEKAMESPDLSPWAANALALFAERQKLPNGFEPLKEVNSHQVARRLLAVAAMERSQEADVIALAARSNDRNEQIQRVAMSRLWGHSASGMSVTSNRPALNLKAASRALSSKEASLMMRMNLLGMLDFEILSGNPSALEVIVQAIEDPEAQIRDRVILALKPALTAGHEKVAFPSAAKALYRGFRDPDTSVRANATSTLDRFIELRLVGSPFDPLVSIHGDEPGERYIAVQMIDAKKPEGTTLLLDAARDEEARVRRAAILGLKRIDTAKVELERVLTALSVASRDADPGVRDAAEQTRRALQPGAVQPRKS